MSFRRQNKTSWRGRLLVPAVLVLLILFATWRYESVSEVVFGITGRVAHPFESAKNASVTAAKGVVDTLRPRKDILAENEVLRQQLATLEEKKTYDMALVQENTELRTALGRIPSTEHVVLATVLARPRQIPYDTLVIDAGTNNGVSVGELVVTDGDTAVGKIYEVAPAISKVKMFSSPGEKTLVTMGDKNISLEAIGLGGGDFVVSVPRDVTLPVGSPVIFPYTSTRVVGTIERVSVRPSDSFQFVFFKNPFNMTQMRFVQVVKD